MDGGITWKDAFLPYAVTHAAVVGGKAIAGKVGDATGIGGGGDDGYKDFTGGDPAAYQYGRDPNAANAAVGQAQATGNTGMVYGAQAVGSGRDAAQTGANLMAQHQGAASAFNNRLAPQGEFSAQNQTLGQLGSIEATQGPSAAQAQLQQGTNQALAGQMALARSGRGFGGNAASAGLAQGNVAGIQANQANSAAMLTAQEDAAFRGRQASNLSNIAGFQGQQSTANLQAALAGRGQNDAMFGQQTALGDQAYFSGQGVQQNAYGLGLQGVNTSLQGQGLANNVRGQEMQGGIAGEDAKLREWAAKNGYTLTQQELADKKEAAYVNAAATGATAAIAASDIRAKTRIAPADGAGQDFARSSGPMTAMQARFADQPGVLDHANTRPVAKPIDDNAFDAAAADAVRRSPASFYDYKDPGAPGASPGRKYGPMAQDLLQTPAGASAVVKQPDGQLGVDTGRLALVHNGAINEQQKQIDSLSAQLDAITNGQEKQGYGFSGYAR